MFFKSKPSKLTLFCGVSQLIAVLFGFWFKRIIRWVGWTQERKYRLDTVAKSGEHVNHMMNHRRWQLPTTKTIKARMIKIFIFGKVVFLSFLKYSSKCDCLGWTLSDLWRIFTEDNRFDSVSFYTLSVEEKSFHLVSYYLLLISQKPKPIHIQCLTNYTDHIVVTRERERERERVIVSFIMLVIQHCQ